MTIYVDRARQWGAPGKYKGEGAAQAERVGAKHGHQWCHMFADEADCLELHEMAQKIGLKREWFQRGHYDLVPTKRAMAIRLGAVEVDDARSVEIWKMHRLTAQIKAPSTEAAAAYLLDRAGQYDANDASPSIVTALEEAAIGIAKGEHLKAMIHGELDDLIPQVRRMAGR